MAKSGMLKGKTCLVTGASRGMGSAIAECFAEQGAALILAARSTDSLHEVAERCKAAGAASCEVATCDLSDRASIDALADKYAASVDVLVNNAGVSKGSNDILEGNPDDWKFTLNVNTLAPMRLTRLIAPGMAKKGGGTIINIGSVAGTHPSPKNAPYSTSKWAVRGWVLACYEELRSMGIKTMVIEPGYVNTPMVNKQENLDPSKMIQPSDIALTALLPFTLSPAAVPLEVVLTLEESAYRQGMQQE